MDFESYLITKRIDSARFNRAEPELWQSWRTDFDQMHPNSFTVQKLNLINPIRRKYQLTVTELPKPAAPPISKALAAPVAKTVSKVPRPGMPKVVNVERIEPQGSASSEPMVPAASDSISEAIPDSNAAAKTDAIAAVDPLTPATSESLTPLDALKPTDGNPSYTGSSIDKSDTQGAHGEEKPDSETSKPVAKPAKPVIPRPVIKPKPKTN